MRPVGTTPAYAALGDSLLKAGCIQFGSFKLKSGVTSPIYVDLRRLVSYPAVLEQVGAAYIPVLRSLTFARLAALPYAALPIAAVIALKGNYPVIYPRKEVKDYGTMAEIEGVFHAGETVAVVDDIATTGGSKLEAIEKLKKAGLVVRDIVVLVDRESGAKQALTQAGYALHSVMSLGQLLDHYDRQLMVDADRIAEAREFLARTNA